VFAIIEKTGLLGQFIRCVLVDPELTANTVTGLKTCLQLAKEKLKSETPTDDILDAVIAGKDGPSQVWPRQATKFGSTLQLRM
jgi:hypothetical protein